MRDVTEVRAQAVHYGNRIELLIGQRLAGDRFAAGTLTFTELEPDHYMEPSVALRIPEAQLLMDELWRCGLRPTEGKGSAGSLAATENHLQDLRTLLFHTLDIKQEARHG